MTLDRLRLAPFAVVFLAAAALAACGGKGGPPSRVTSEFTTADAVLFDNGVDFIEGALSLQGRWQKEWVDEVRQRTERADLIAEASVRTIRIDESPSGDNTYRITVDLGAKLKGSAGAHEATLITTPASRGYRTVDAHTDHVESGDYLLFGKWAVVEDGSEAMHWHLSPASEDVRAAVNRIVRGEASGDL